MKNTSRWGCRFVGVMVAAFVLAALWPGGLLLAYDWDEEDCKGCHTDDSIVEQGGGYLFVDPDRYERTSHADVGCPSCHESVSEDHPEDRVRPSRAGCGECHDDVEAEYAQSAHAGNATCTDCHNPHEVQPVVKVSGTDMNRACMQCHEEEDVVQTHGSWLPQTTLHIRAMPCITCHAGSENYVITFYVEMLEERAGRSPVVALATHDELMKRAGGKGSVTSVIDSNADGHVSAEELRLFYREGRAEGLQLWGMMTPEVATHNYTTLDNRWDCSFCHASGPGAVQKSFVALPGPAGEYTRIPVESGAVLDALYGTADFYMIGATRSRILSILGIAIILGGLAVPLVHGTLRLLTMRNRREH
jgi:predicted CXXCH cytochrome family protein